MYFSTFEPIDLTPDSIMQQAGVPMLYDSASNPRLPCLYIHPVESAAPVTRRPRHPPAWTDSDLAASARGGRPQPSESVQVTGLTRISRPPAVRVSPSGL